MEMNEDVVPVFLIIGAECWEKSERSRFAAAASFLPIPPLNALNANQSGQACGQFANPTDVSFIIPLQERTGV